MPRISEEHFRELLEDFLSGEGNEDCTFDYDTIRYDEDFDAMTCEMEDGYGRIFVVHEEDDVIHVL